MVATNGMYGERRVINTEFWWGNLKEKDRWEDFSLDGKIILKWLLKNTS
jgi:hypothetical protein